MVAVAGLAKAGVALVVEGLPAFKNAIGQATNVLDAMRPKATLLERVFKSLGNTIRNFAENIIKRILVIAFGVLVRDAIRKVIDIMGEMVTAVIAGGDAFQRLEIRLNRLNMNSLKEAGMSASDALRESIALTKEQIMWAVELAGLTVYDAADIANAYTLARSYGFVDDTARKLTERILDFSSGMGLTGVHIERIITNLGQMVQQGKITGTELRDLARGSFVPVNKVLKILAEDMGMTTEELNKMRKAGTTDPQWFIEAFMKLMGEDFSGATVDMAKSFTGAMANIKDVFVGTFSALASSPILSVLGKRVSDLVSAFYDGKKLKSGFVDAFTRIGKSISNIINKIFNLLPGVNSIADTVIAGLQNVASWLETNEDEIASWVKSALDFMASLADAIKNDVVPWIRDELIPAIERFGKWFSENKETIMTVLSIIIGGFLLWQGTVIATRIAIAALMFTITWPLKLLATLLTGIIGLFASLGAIAATAWGAMILWANNAKNKISEFFLPREWENSGNWIIQGLIAGLRFAAPGLFAVVNWLATTAINIFNSIFNMKSPSKVMFDAGINITKGMAKGITSGAKQVLGVTTALANSISSTLSGTKTTSSTITAGVTTSKTSDYLSNTGEVMRSKLDQTTGDPCAKGTAASCAADKVAGALGGIGSALVAKIEEVKEKTLAQMQAMYNREGEAWDRVRAAMTAANAETLENRVGLSESLTAGANINRAIERMAQGATGHIQDARDRIKEIAAEAMGSTSGLVNYATEDLKAKSTQFSTGVSEIARLNNERAKTSSDKVVASVLDTNSKAVTANMNFTLLAGNLITRLINAAIEKINSISSSSSSSSGAPKVTTTSSITSTTNVTNNFGKGTGKGSQVTFDYESQKFWM